MKTDITKWAFRNRNLIYFLIAVLVVGGVLSAWQMSKLEDPEVKVKLAMVVTTYPGASAHQVELEVTDVLEKKIRTMGNVDNIESYSYNDLSLIQVELLSTVDDDKVEQCWDMLRLTGDGNCIITSPTLKAGDIVVSAGVHAIRNGEKVKLLLPTTETNVGGLL